MRLTLSADSSWNRWHPTYEQLGERCQRLGLDALELVYYPQNDGFDRVSDTMAQYGVDIVCVNATAKHRINMVDDPALVQQELIRCITLAADLGARYVVMYAGHNPRWNLRERIELFRRRMEPCFAAATDRKVTLLLENHFDLRGEDPHYTDVVRNPDLTALFMEALDCEQVRINFDAGNVYAAGVEPWPYAYRLLRDYISYAHLKDMAYFSELLYGPFSANETLSDSKAGDFLPVAVGDGGINYWGLLREMASDGVAEFAAFEDHSLPENADQIYERGVAFANAALASAGTRH